MATKAVTFDVYSALFDTVGGLTEALRSLFTRNGVTADPQAAARVWRQKHAEYLLIANSLDREPASNRRALEASLAQALRPHLRALPPTEIQQMVAAWEHLPRWPEAKDVLEEVKRRGLIVGALSNGDGAMLRALLATLPVPFDPVISTEGGRFKPHPSVYAKTLTMLRVPTDELLHVAGSHTDAAGATAAGIRTVWVNRAGETVFDERFAPAHVVSDLRGVLEFL